MGDWYNANNVPGNGASLSSSVIRSEFADIETAMNKLPTLTAKGGYFAKVNAGGTALESVDLFGAANEWTGSQNFNMTTITSSSNAVAWDVGANQITSHVMTENTTVGQPTNGNPGMFITMLVTQAAGLYSLSWDSSYKGSIPDSPGADGEKKAYTFFCVSSTEYILVGSTEDV